MTIAEQILESKYVRPEGIEDPTTDYALDVIDGLIVAGPNVRLGCQRHLDDLKNGHERDLYFDVEAANKVIAWFPQNLCHYQSDFGGSPFVLDPSQGFIVGSLFGWKRVVKTDRGLIRHLRRFQTAFVSIGKGNGKTPLAAGIGLYCLTDDGEKAPLIYAAAVTKGQAHEVYLTAKSMAEESPRLRKRLKIGDYGMSCPKNKGRYKSVSSEAKSLDGPTPSVSLVDEVHEHRTAQVINKLNAGKKTRANPLMLEITNTGHDKNTICGEHFDLSEMILQGIVENDQWFAYLCGLEDEDDWANEEQWQMANPLLGVSIESDYLRTQIEEAKLLPTKLNLVKRLNLCIWTESDKQWLPTDAWQALAAPRPEEDLLGQGFGHAIDMSGNSDFTAHAHLFAPNEKHSKPYLKTSLYLPNDTLRATQDPEILSRLMEWAEAGWINIMPGGMIDRKRFRDAALEDCKKYGGDYLAYDRWQMDELAQFMAGEGMTTVMINQNHNAMNSPCLAFERMVMLAEFEHDGNPAIAWMLRNTSLDMNSKGYVMPNKGRRGKKIDGIVANIMICGVYEKPPVIESNESRYNTMGQG